MESHSKNQAPITPEMGLAEADCLEIKTSITRAILRRKDVIDLLKTLEEAWKMAITPNFDLESPEAASIKVPETANNTVEEAQEKRKEVGKLENQIFLSFEELTSSKHEEQLKLGQTILNSLPAKSLEEMLTLTEKTQHFFENEDLINKEFLRKIHQVSKKTNLYLVEIEKISTMTCTNTKLEKLLAKNLKLLKDFLLATKNLLEG